MDQKGSDVEELEEEEPEIAPVEQMEEAEEPEDSPEPAAAPPPAATRVSSEPEHDVTFQFLKVLIKQSHKCLSKIKLRTRKMITL